MGQPDYVNRAEKAQFYGAVSKGCPSAESLPQHNPALATGLSSANSPRRGAERISGSFTIVLMSTLVKVKVKKSHYMPEVNRKSKLTRF